MVNIKIRKFRAGQDTEVMERNGYQAYTQSIFGNGRKYGWYVHLAKGTRNFPSPKPNRFKTKRAAQKFMIRWLTSK